MSPHHPAECGNVSLSETQQNDKKIWFKSKNAFISEHNFFFAILKRAKLEINKINTLDPAIWNCQGKRKVRNYGFMAYFSRRIILWLTFPKELTSHKRFFPPFFLSFSLKTSETRKS